jgi:hypothetical protein
MSEDVSYRGFQQLVLDGRLKDLARYDLFMYYGAQEDVAVAVLATWRSPLDNIVRYAFGKGQDAMTAAFDALAEFDRNPNREQILFELLAKKAHVP